MLPLDLSSLLKVFNMGKTLLKYSSNLRASECTTVRLNRGLKVLLCIYFKKFTSQKVFEKLFNVNNALLFL